MAAIQFIMPVNAPNELIERRLPSPRNADANWEDRRTFARIRPVPSTPPTEVPELRR